MIHRLWQLLFPPRCVLCKTLLGKEETDLCHHCRENAPELERSDFRLSFVARWTALWYYNGKVRSSILRYKFRNLSIGKLCLFIDGAVVTLYALVFGSINNSLYGIIAMYICSIVMDMVIYGTANDKLAYIISDHSDEISRKLLSMDLGVTILDGKGAYSGNAKQVLMCVVRRNQINPIKALASHIDPNAFVIITEAHEVLGEGFAVYDPESI